MEVFKVKVIYGRNYYPERVLIGKIVEVKDMNVNYYQMVSGKYKGTFLSKNNCKLLLDIIIEKI